MTWRRESEDDILCVIKANSLLSYRLLSSASKDKGDSLRLEEPSVINIADNNFNNAVKGDRPASFSLASSSSNPLRPRTRTKTVSSIDETNFRSRLHSSMSSDFEAGSFDNTRTTFSSVSEGVMPMEHESLTYPLITTSSLAAFTTPSTSLVSIVDFDKACQVETIQLPGKVFCTALHFICVDEVGLWLAVGTSKGSVTIYNLAPLQDSSVDSGYEGTGVRFEGLPITRSEISIREAGGSVGAIKKLSWNKVLGWNVLQVAYGKNKLAMLDFSTRTLLQDLKLEDLTTKGGTDEEGDFLSLLNVKIKPQAAQTSPERYILSSLVCSPSGSFIAVGSLKQSDEETKHLSESAPNRRTSTTTSRLSTATRGKIHLIRTGPRLNPKWVPLSSLQHVDSLELMR